MKSTFLNIFENFNKFKTKKFTNFSPIVTELPKKINKLMYDNNRNFRSDGSNGKGNFAHIIWCRIADHQVSKSAQAGMYIVYLFNYDLSGVYLSLNFGVTEIEDTNIIMQISNYFKKQVKSSYFSKSDIDLKDPKNKKAINYQAGNIISKYYSLNDIKKIDENTLVSDLFEMCKEYDSLIKNNSLKNTSLFDLYKTEIKGIEGVEKVDKKKNNEILPFGFNMLYYGIPGCGKSYFAKNKANEILKNYTENNYRVTFYYDYTYSDFIGQVLPKSINGELKYDFSAGIFTRALKKAISNPSEPVVLIIEEINRGNAPAIFGEIFQLLDRDDNGISEYKIKNVQIAHEVGFDEDDDIYLPKNFYIIATMNTSDQNVFPLDTAFKRRWSLKYIQDKQSNEKFNKKMVPNITYNGKNILWDDFHRIINLVIQETLNGSYNCEDKGIGYFFMKESEFEDASLFGEKIFQFLWFDVFNLKHQEVFNAETYKELIQRYEIKGLELFGNDLNSLFKLSRKPHQEL